jgi:hypothetical protein
MGVKQLLHDGNTAVARRVTVLHAEWRDVAGPTNSDRRIGQCLGLRNPPPLCLHGVQSALYSRVLLQRLAHQIVQGDNALIAWQLRPASLS